jgi:hypothetical protein
MRGERARSADTFVDSIGVATHLSYDDTPYGDYEGLVKPRLAEAGIRHIRDGAADADVRAKMADLAATAGVRATVVWSGDPLEEVRAASRELHAAGALAAVEGPNECDLEQFRFSYEGEGFPAGCQRYQRELYEMVKGDPELSEVPVVMAAMGWGKNSERFGDLSAYADRCNTHDYPGHENAQLTDFVDTWSIPYARSNCGPDKPFVSTETGYSTAWQDGGVSELAQAIHVPRILLEHFNRGFERTHLYELVDERDRGPDDREANFGLLRVDGTPKPAYDALANLIAILEEPGASFTPGALDVRLGGDSGNVHHTLLQHSDGTFFLLLWQDVQVWDGENDVAVPEVQVDVELPQPAAVRTYRPLESADARPVADAASSVSVGVPADVLIVEIAPAG